MTEQFHGFFIPLFIYPQKERFNDNEIVRIMQLDPLEVARCSRCQQRKTLHWYVEDADGSWGVVCKGCGAALLEKLRRRGDAGHE